MNHTEIKDIKDRIIKHLDAQEVKQAFALLKQLATQLQEWHVGERLNDAETTYRYLLTYQFQGMEDPQREDVFAGIMRLLYELTDDVCEELMAKDSPALFFEKRRLMAHREPQSPAALHQQLVACEEKFRLAELWYDGDDKMQHLRQLAVERERLATDMFLLVFVAERLQAHHAEEYVAWLQNEELSEQSRCLLLSALTLNIMQRFDSKVFDVILQTTTAECSELRMRAIVGVIFTMMLYSSRLSYYTEWRKVVSVRMEDNRFRQLFEAVLVQLIRAKETEKISQKMLNEIVPQMMKFSSLSGKKLSMEDLNGETDFMEKNPEWEKNLQESGLADKLREYSELHLEGADVFHSSFAGLKNNFPFFRELSNWFLPFDTSYSQLLNLASQKQPIIEAVLKSEYMCDSDKYSFCFALQLATDRHGEMAVQHFGGDNDQMSEIQKDAKSVNPNIKEEMISNRYLQNFYRFLKLFPRRDSFFDVFRLSVNFYQYEAFRPFVMRVDVMDRLADYCFRKNRFSEAENIYELMVNTFADNQRAEWWQKIGYCCQLQNRPTDAVAAYEQADLLDADNVWVIKRLAQCHRTMGNHQKALEYYRRADILQPDNESVTMNIGHCLLALEQYSEALNAYFKVEFTHSATAKTQRPIAWTALLAQKFDLAESYYQQLLTSSPTLHDYLNLGHIYLITNRYEKAVTHYTHSARMAKTFEEFAHLFADDHAVLVRLGADASLFVRLLDAVQYQFDKQ